MTFYNVESPLPSLCPGFMHSVVVRDPLKRAVSQARDLVRWGMLAKGMCSNYTEWKRVAPALFDNYYVRMLDGEKTFLKPLGAVTRNDARRAEDTLSHFTLVTTLANMSNAFGAFGIVVPRRGESSSALCRLTRSDANEFRKTNRWDFDIYERLVGARHDR